MSYDSSNWQNRSKLTHSDMFKKEKDYNSRNYGGEEKELISDVISETASSYVAEELTMQHIDLLTDTFKRKEYEHELEIIRLREEIELLQSTRIELENHNEMIATSLEEESLQRRISSIISDDEAIHVNTIPAAALALVVEPLSESIPEADNYIYDSVPPSGIEATFILPLKYDASIPDDSPYDSVEWAVSPTFIIPPTHSESGGGSTSAHHINNANRPSFAHHQPNTPPMVTSHGDWRLVCEDSDEISLKESPICMHLEQKCSQVLEASLHAGTVAGFHSHINAQHVSKEGIQGSTTDPNNVAHRCYSEWSALSLGGDTFIAGPLVTLPSNVESNIVDSSCFLDTLITSIQSSSIIAGAGYGLKLLVPIYRSSGHSTGYGHHHAHAHSRMFDADALAGVWILSADRPPIEGLSLPDHFHQSDVSASLLHTLAAVGFRTKSIPTGLGLEQLSGNDYVNNDPSSYEMDRPSLFTILHQATAMRLLSLTGGLLKVARRVSRRRSEELVRCRDVVLGRAGIGLVGRINTQGGPSSIGPLEVHNCLRSIPTLMKHLIARTMIIGGGNNPSGNVGDFHGQGTNMHLNNGANRDPASHNPLLSGPQIDTYVVLVATDALVDPLTLSIASGEKARVPVLNGQVIAAHSNHNKQHHSHSHSQYNKSSSQHMQNLPIKIHPGSAISNALVRAFANQVAINTSTSYTGVVGATSHAHKNHEINASHPPHGLGVCGPAWWWTPHNNSASAEDVGGCSPLEQSMDAHGLVLAVPLWSPGAVNAGTAICPVCVYVISAIPVLPPPISVKTQGRNRQSHRHGSNTKRNGRTPLLSPVASQEHLAMVEGSGEDNMGQGHDNYNQTSGQLPGHSSSDSNVDPDAGIGLHSGSSYNAKVLGFPAPGYAAALFYAINEIEDGDASQGRCSDLALELYYLSDATLKCFAPSCRTFIDATELLSLDPFHTLYGASGDSTSSSSYNTADKGVAISVGGAVTACLPAEGAGVATHTNMKSNGSDTKNVIKNESQQATAMLDPAILTLGRNIASLAKKSMGASFAVSVVGLWMPKNDTDLGESEDDCSSDSSSSSSGSGSSDGESDEDIDKNAHDGLASKHVGPENVNGMTLAVIPNDYGFEAVNGDGLAVQSVDDMCPYGSLRDLLENVLIGRRLKANDPNHHRKYAGSHNNDSAHDHTNGHQQSSRPQGSLYNSRDSSSGYVCHNEMHINTPGLARMLSVAQSSGIGDSHHQHRHQHHHHHHHHHHRDSSKSSYLDGSLSTIQMAGFLLLDPVSMGLHLDAALTVPSKPTRSRRRLMRRLQVAGSIRIAVLLGRSWRQFPSPLVAAGLLGTSSSVVSSYGGQQPFALSALIQHNKSQLEDIRQVVIHLKGVAEALLVARCKDGLLRNMEQLAGHVATLEAERRDAVDMRNKIENWLVQVETGQNVSSSSLERDGVEDQTSKRHTNTHADGGVTSMTSSEPGLEGQSHSPLLKFQSSERIRSRLASGLSGFCAQICGHKRMYLEAHISIRPTWTTHHHSHSEDGTHDTSHSTGHHSGRRHHHHHPAQEHDLENISDANTSRHVVLVLAADGKWIREASPVTTIHMDENTIGDGSASASEHHHQGTFTTAVDPQTIDWHRICLWSSHSSGHPAQAVLNMVEELEKQIEAELQFSTTAGNSGANNNSNINPTLLDINTTLILTCEPFEGVAPEVKSAGVTAACTGHVARCLATWLAVHHRTVCRSNSDHHHHHRHHHHHHQHHGHNNNDYNRSKGSTRLLGQLVGDSLGAGLPAITALIGRHVVGSDLQADYEESHVESDFQGSVEASGAMEGQAVASPAEVSLASEMNTGKNIIVRKLSTRHVVHLLQFCYESTHGTPTSTSVHGSHRINQHQQHYSHRHSGIKQAELVGFQDVLSLFSLDNHNSNHSHRHHQFQHSSANGGDPSATHDTHSKGQTPQLFPHKLVLLAAPSGGVDVALLRGTAVIPYLAACAGINLGQNTNIAMSKGRGSRQPRSQIADNFISANLGDIEPTGLYIVLTMPYERQTAVFGDTLTGTGGHSNNHGHSNDHHTHDHYLKNGRSIRHRNGGTWLVVFILRVEDPTETRRNSSRTTTTQASGATSSDVRPNHHHHHHHDHGHLTQLGSSKPITFGWPSLVSLTALRTVFLSVQSLLSLEGAMGRPIFSHFFLRSAMELLVTGSGHSHDHDVQDSSKSQRMGDVNEDRDRITLGASVSVRNKDQSRRAALRARRRSGLKSTQVHEVTVQGMLKNLLALTSAKLGRMLVHSIDTGTSSYDYMDGDNENDDSSVSSGSSSGVDAANVSLPRHAHCFLLHDLSVASGHVLPSKRIYGHIKMFSGLANADEGDSDGEGEDDDCILAGSHQILSSIGDAQIDLTEYGTGEAEAPNGSVTTALWSLDTLYGDSLYNGAADTSSATPSATPSSVGEGGGVGVGQDRVLKGSLPTALMDADIIVRLKFYLPSSVSHILNQAYKVSKLMPHSEQSYHHSHGHQGRSQERQVLAVVLFPLYGGGIESSLNTEGLLRTTPALLDLLGISAKVSGLMLKTFAPFWSHPHAIKLAHKTICDTTQALSAASGDIDGSNNSATGNDFIVSAAVGSKPYRYHTDTETETDDAFAGVGSQADWSSLIQDIQSLEQEANHSAIIRRALKDSQRRCDILSRTIVSISGAICPEDVAKEIWFDILESNRNMSIGTNTAPNDATDLKNSHGNWQLQLADVNLGSCEVSAVDNLCTCLSVIADYQGRLQQDFLCMLLRYGGLVALEEATNVLTAAAKTIGEELHAPLPSPVVWWSHDIATRPDHEVNSSPARGSGRNSNNNGNNGRSNSYTIPIKSREHLAIRGMYSVDMLESAIRTGQRVQFTDTVGGTSGASILKPRIASKAETTAAAAAAAVNGNISSNVDNANISTMDFFSSLLHDNAKGRDDSGGRVTSSNQDLRIGLGVTHTLGSKTETVVYSPLLYPSNPKNESSSRVSHSNRVNILNNSHNQRANLVQAVVQYRQVESRGSKHNANINHHDGNLGTSISDTDHNNSNSNSNEPIWMPPTSSNVGERGSTLAVRIFESSLLSLSESLRSVSAGIDRPLIQMPPASTAVTSASTNGKNSLKDRDVMSGRNDYNSSNIIDGGIIPILPRDVALQKIYTPYGGLLSESLSALSQVIREIVCEGGKDASDGPISNALHTALRRRLAMAAGSVLAAMIGSQARVAVLFFDSHSHTHTHTDDQGRLKQEKVVPLGGDDLHLHGHNHRYADESLSGDLYSLDLFDDAATGDHIGSVHMSHLPSQESYTAASGSGVSGTSYTHTNVDNDNELRKPSVPITVTLGDLLLAVNPPEDRVAMQTSTHHRRHHHHHHNNNNRQGYANNYNTPGQMNQTIRNTTGSGNKPADKTAPALPKHMHRVHLTDFDFSCHVNVVNSNDTILHKYDANDDDDEPIRREDLYCTAIPLHTESAGVDSFKSGDDIGTNGMNNHPPGIPHRDHRHIHGFIVMESTRRITPDDFKSLYSMGDIVASSLGVTIQAVLARQMLAERRELQIKAREISRHANRKAAFGIMCQDIMTSASNTLHTVEAVIDVIQHEESAFSTSASASSASSASTTSNLVISRQNALENREREVASKSADYQKYRKLFLLGLDKWDILDLKIGRLSDDTVDAFEGIFPGLCGVCMVPVAASRVHSASVMHRKGEFTLQAAGASRHQDGTMQTVMILATPTEHGTAAGLAIALNSVVVLKNNNIDSSSIPLTSEGADLEVDENGGENHETGIMDVVYASAVNAIASATSTTLEDDSQRDEPVVRVYVPVMDQHQHVTSTSASNHHHHHHHHGHNHHRKHKKEINSVTPRMKASWVLAMDFTSHEDYEAFTDENLLVNRSTNISGNASGSDSESSSGSDDDEDSIEDPLSTGARAGQYLAYLVPILKQSIQSQISTSAQKRVVQSAYSIMSITKEVAISLSNTEQMLIAADLRNQSIQANSSTNVSTEGAALPFNKKGFSSDRNLIDALSQLEWVFGSRYHQHSLQHQHHNHNYSNDSNDHKKCRLRFHYRYGTSGDWYSVDSVALEMSTDTQSQSNHEGNDEVNVHFEKSTIPSMTLDEVLVRALRQTQPSQSHKQIRSNNKSSSNNGHSHGHHNHPITVILPASTSSETGPDQTPSMGDHTTHRQQEADDHLTLGLQVHQHIHTSIWLPILFTPITNAEDTNLNGNNNNNNNNNRNINNASKNASGISHPTSCEAIQHLSIIAQFLPGSMLHEFDANASLIAQVRTLVATAASTTTPSDNANPTSNRSSSRRPTNVLNPTNNNNVNTGQTLKGAKANAMNAKEMGIHSGVGTASGGDGYYAGRDSIAGAIGAAVASVVGGSLDRACRAHEASVYGSMQVQVAAVLSTVSSVTHNISTMFQTDDLPKVSTKKEINSSEVIEKTRDKVKSVCQMVESCLETGLPGVGKVWISLTDAKEGEMLYDTMEHHPGFGNMGSILMSATDKATASSSGGRKYTYPLQPKRQHKVGSGAGEGKSEFTITREVRGGQLGDIGSSNSPLDGMVCAARVSVSAGDGYILGSVSLWCDVIERDGQNYTMEEDGSCSNYDLYRLCNDTVTGLSMDGAGATDDTGNDYDSRGAVFASAHDADAHILESAYFVTERPDRSRPDRSSRRDNGISSSFRHAATVIPNQDSRSRQYKAAHLNDNLSNAIENIGAYAKFGEERHNNNNNNSNNSNNIDMDQSSLSRNLTSMHAYMSSSNPPTDSFKMELRRQTLGVKKAVARSIRALCAAICKRIYELVAGASKRIKMHEALLLKERLKEENKNNGEKVLQLERTLLDLQRDYQTETDKGNVLQSDLDMERKVRQELEEELMHLKQDTVEEMTRIKTDYSRHELQLRSEIKMLEENERKSSLVVQELQRDKHQEHMLEEDLMNTSSFPPAVDKTDYDGNNQANNINMKNITVPAPKQSESQSSLSKIMNLGNTEATATATRRPSLFQSQSQGLSQGLSQGISQGIEFTFKGRNSTSNADINIKNIDSYELKDNDKSNQSGRREDEATDFFQSFLNDGNASTAISRTTPPRQTPSRQTTHSSSNLNEKQIFHHQKETPPQKQSQSTTHPSPSSYDYDKALESAGSSAVLREETRQLHEINSELTRRVTGLEANLRERDVERALLVQSWRDMMLGATPASSTSMGDKGADSEGHTKFVGSPRHKH